MALAETLVDQEQLRADWARGYESQPEEHAGWVSAVSGAIPPELSGTLFRNGPGLLDVGGRRLHHPFDGDGLVAAFSFVDGRCFYRSRFVRTAGYLAERRAGRLLFRGVFGTQRPGGWLANALDLRLKNVANTNVVHWANRLLALWEAAEPHRLDPRTLDTYGVDRLGGLLRDGEPFAAHPHIDPFCHWDGGAPCLVTFGVKPRFDGTSVLKIYEIGPDGLARRTQELEIDGFAFLHDMAITPNYCVFFQNPLRYDPLPYLFGRQSAAQGLRSLPGQATSVLVVPRHPSLGEPRTFQAPPGFVWHHANACEEGDTLHIDSVWYDRFESFSPAGDFRALDFAQLPYGVLARTSVDLRTGATERRELGARCCEFPVLHPGRVGRDYRYVYTAAADAPEGPGILQTLWKVDVASGASEVWSPGPRCFAGEPVFVPRPRSAAVAHLTTPDVGDPIGNTGPGEDDGWLLALVYDGARHGTDLAILDARDLAAGPVATLHLDHHLPHGLHGSFSSGRFAPEDRY